MKEAISLDFAATTIGTMLIMLQSKGYTDTEIAAMFSKQKVRDILSVLKGQSQAAQYLQTVDNGLIVDERV